MSDKLTLTKLELLRMSRELVINEYIDKRAQDHNAWIAQADVVWRTQGVRLAYPTFPQYPTEVDILTRARTLNTFLSAEDQTAEVEPTPQVAEAIPAQMVDHKEVIEIEAKDVKEISQPEPTNYISNPKIFGEILNKQTTSVPTTPTVADTEEQPMSALAKLKNSLGLK